MNQNPSISELHAAANGIKHLTAEQLEELMTVAMKESARDHAMLLVIFHHALRASEAADLKLSDLELVIDGDYHRPQEGVHSRPCNSL